MYDCIIVGCGCAGATIARILAEAGKSVLILEKRDHIGGNCYDTYDSDGILIHLYGPHIFHTNKQNVYEFLSRFTEWYNYSHEVLANIHGTLVPVPFNLNTLEIAFPEKCKELESKLTSKYGIGARVPILQLMNDEDEDIKAIAQYVYENIFLRYTMKQWGQKPEEVDSSVTARVPVLISSDNRYFQDTYQGMPLHGYTEMFKNMLDHPNIEVSLSCNALSRITLEDGRIRFDGKTFNGQLVYTGEVDDLFKDIYGALPYRTLDFVFENYPQKHFQPKGVVNYTVSEDYTRITEFKYLTNQTKDNCTTIVKEYSKAYEKGTGQIPYYAILNEENNAKYNRYASEAAKYKNLTLLGRLAEYKYYNIDAIVDRALKTAEELLLQI
ncbi:MAG: UDP-galactopyranose mutase [Lachnospiraceae bacterium]